MSKITNMEDLDKYYKKLSKESLKVVLTMASPIVLPTHFLHFDAILTDLIAKRFFGDEGNRWNSFESHINIPLPLKQYGKQQKVWQSSIAYTRGLMKDYESMWTRKPFDKYAGDKSNGVIWGEGVLSNEQIKAGTVTFEKDFIKTNARESGPYRSFFETRYVRRAEEVIFFVNGNQEAIETLLKDLHFIGKKRGIGFGEIAYINIEENENDYSLIDMDGSPSRVIPLSEADKLNIDESKKNILLYPYIPAYANIKNRVMCIAPSSNLPHIQENIIDEEDEFDEEDEIYFV